VRIRYPALAVLALATATSVAACGSSGGTSSGDGSGSGDSGKQTVAGASVNFHGMKDVTGMSSVDIEADNFYFEPTVLKGTPGQHLTLTIKNSTDTEHNFTVESQHVDKDIEDGKTVTLSVTLPSTGTIRFFCKYHHGSGMGGGLQSG
jgi:plastocyanin